jgi:transposase
MALDLKLLENLLRSETRARQFFVQKCWREKKPFCIRCGSRLLYRLADKRYRCGQCGYTFHDFTGRWIGELNLRVHQWVWVLKFFELEVPPQRMAKEVGISYPTALKAIYLIRRAITHSLGDNVFCLGGQTGPAGEPRHGPAEAMSVFGIVERNGKVSVCVPGEVSPDSVLREQSKLVKHGSIVFTGRFRDYDAVILRLRRLPPSVAKRVHGKISLNGLDGFWNFARPRLSNFHGTSDQELLFFLNELAFRYNHREHELFDSLADLLTQIMPNT